MSHYPPSPRVSLLLISQPSPLWVAIYPRWYKICYSQENKFAPDVKDLKYTQAEAWDQF